MNEHDFGPAADYFLREAAEEWARGDIQFALNLAKIAAYIAKRAVS